MLKKDYKFINKHNHISKPLNASALFLLSLITNRLHFYFLTNHAVKLDGKQKSILRINFTSDLSFEPLKN